MAVAVFHPVTETVEVVMFASRSGQERRNVIHYKYGLLGGGRPTVTELTNLLNDVIGSIINEQEDCTSIGTTWYKVSARDIHDEFGAVAEVNTTRVGSLVGNVMPGAVSICMSKRSGIPGRSKRGRFYLFDLDEASINGDDIAPAFNVPMTELAQALLLPRQGSRFIPCIASKRLGTSVPMTSMTWDQVSDTQVRRGKGRGR